MNSPELKIIYPSRKYDTLDPRLKFVVSRKDKQLVSRHLSQKCLWHHRMSKVPGSENVPYCPACEQIGNHGLVFTGLMWEVVTLVENDPVKREVMFSQLAKHLGHFAGFRNLDVKLKRVKPLWDKLRSSLNRMILTLKTDSAPVDGYFLQASRFQRDYENLVPIKRGGYAMVYSGTNKLDGNSYAFKVVPFRFKTREDYETIMREIQILAALEPHPNLIAYKTCWVEKWISAGKSSVFKTAKLALPPACHMTVTTTTTDTTSGTSSCWETTEESSTFSSLTAPDPSPQVIIGSIDDLENIEVVTQIIKSEGHLVDDDFFLNNRVRTSSGGSESGDGFDFGASLYIQMELCGKSLKTWIKERNDRLLKLASNGGQTKCLPAGNDLTDCFNIFKQILIGVKVIHDNEVIHRDLKPENILFGLDGKIKIGDFGLSTRSNCKEDLDSPDSPTESLDMDYTVGLGTSAYAAPEQLHKVFDQYDHKVDIFSVGMVAFEIFHPFATKMERAKAFDDLRRHSLPLYFCISLPEVAKMILQMTSYLPNDRPEASKILVSKLFAQNGRSKMDGLRNDVAILKSQLLEKDEEIRMLREENRRLHVALLRSRKKAKYYVPILDKPNSHLARRITR